MEINKSLIKYTLILLTAPIWWRFLKMIWETVHDALRPEGGVFGATPSPRRQREIEEELASKEGTLVHERFATPEERRRAAAARSAGGALRDGRSGTRPNSGTRAHNPPAATRRAGPPPRGGRGFR